MNSNFAPRDQIVDRYFDQFAGRVSELICHMGVDCGVTQSDFTVKVARGENDTGFHITVEPHQAIDHTLATFFACVDEACKRTAPGASIAREGETLNFTCRHITDLRNVLSMLEKPYESLTMSQSA